MKKLYDYIKIYNYLEHKGTKYKRKYTYKVKNNNIIEEKDTWFVAISNNDSSTVYRSVSEKISKELEEEYQKKDFKAQKSQK